MNDQHAPITLDGCRAWLEDAVFHFRPREYCEKYPQWPGMVGLELEMLAFDASSLAQDYPRLLPLAGKAGLTGILERLAQERGWQAEYLDGVSEKTLFRVGLDDGDQLTFEPGAQLEFSSKPYPCLSDAQRRLETIQAILDKTFAEAGGELVRAGFNPWISTEGVGLQMTKPRYRAMDRYFEGIGPYGRQMMRQTCTIQVNLDFGDSEDVLARRYLAANLVAPFATAMFANSPFTEGRLNGVKSHRGRIWRHIDASRTGFPRLDHLATILRKPTKKACVDAYLESVMNAQVIFVSELGYRNPTRPTTFKDWVAHPIEGVRPTLEDFKTHLSLHFLEVRARGFLELRSVDCQSRVWERVPGAFYTALLYDQVATEQVIETLGPLIDRLPEWLVKSSQGLLDTELASWSRKVMLMVLDGFERLPSCFQGEGTGQALKVFVNHFTAQGRSPADDLLDAAARSKDGHLSSVVLRVVEDEWRRLAT